MLRLKTLNVILNMDNISPKYKLSLAEKVEEVLWDEYGSYDRVLAYIEQWHEMEDYWENFPIEFKDKDRKQISLYSTLCNMPGELLLKGCGKRRHDSIRYLSLHEIQKTKLIRKSISDWTNASNVLDVSRKLKNVRYIPLY